MNGRGNTGPLEQGQLESKKEGAWRERAPGLREAAFLLFHVPCVLEFCILAKEKSREDDAAFLTCHRACKGFPCNTFHAVISHTSRLLQRRAAWDPIYPWCIGAVWIPVLLWRLERRHLPIEVSCALCVWGVWVGGCGVVCWKWSSTGNVWFLIKYDSHICTEKVLDAGFSPLPSSSSSPRTVSSHLV
jgi:hypothetical protein